VAMRGPWVGSALVLVAAHIASALSAQAGRLIGAPVSRRCQGRAAHRRRSGRARVPSVVVAHGSVSAYCSAHEGVAFHLPPNAMAQPVTVKETSGVVAAGCSDGRRGAAGPGAPFLGRLSAVHAVHLGRHNRGWAGALNSRR
jgi:hypothetical protein